MGVVKFCRCGWLCVVFCGIGIGVFGGICVLVGLFGMIDILL